MSWGTGPWGVGPWGSAVPLALAHAVARTTHCVEVTLTQPPRARSVLGAGDGLNPRTWRVSVGGQDFTPVSVEFTDANVCRVYTLHAFQDWRTLHTVAALGLCTPAGILISTPRSLTFRGVAALRAINALSGRYDLANPPTLIHGGASGTLQASSGGGYQQVRGAEFFRKLILRRLTTVPGSFFHIPKDGYGLGLAVKGLIRTSDLMALRALIEQECYREAGVTHAKVEVSLLATGALKVDLKIKVDTGDVATSLLVE